MNALSRALWVAVGLGLCTCKTGKNLASTMVDTPAADQTPLTAGQARCSVAASTERPLVVGWPSTDRVSLEARLRRGPVIARYQGCELEILRQCTLPGLYRYLGTTRKLDRLRIRSADELYANLPTNAVTLEGKLAKAGELSVAMALVGMFEADVGRRDRGALDGDCGGATHLVAGVQVGAFEFVAGAQAELGGGVRAANIAGAGARSTAEREVLAQDGDAAACETSGPDDPAPPPNCGAVVRVELVALADEPPRGKGSVPPKDPVWPEGEPPDREPPDPAPDRRAQTSPPLPADKSADRELCDRYCRRGLQCEAQGQGRAVPEGKQVDRMIGACAAICRPFVNDFSRADLRACVERTECTSFLECAKNGPSLDAD